MDLALNILFYVYVGLAASAPLFVIPALVICHRLSNSLWKAVVAGIPWVGLPLFALMIRFPSQSPLTARSLDRR